MDDTCAQCASQGRTCGDKLRPSDTQLQRYNDAKEKENEKMVLNLIQTRRARGQDWKTILAITDPDGSIAPCPANGQPSQQSPIYHPSYPQQLQPSTNPFSTTPYIPTQNTFGQEYTGADPASFPSMPSTISSTDQMMINNTHINYITASHPQLTQLSPPSHSPITTSFQPLASYTTAQFPFNDFGTHGTQAAFLGNSPTNWPENEDVTTMSETANNWDLSPASALLATNTEMNETYDFDFWDSSVNDQRRY
jgi:hypothetical protein